MEYYRSLSPGLAGPGGGEGRVLCPMFTGIVEKLGYVREVIAQERGRRIGIESCWSGAEVAVGDSVSVNGVCLTAVENTDGRLVFQVGPETLDRTNLGQLIPGDRVNLERSLLPTTRIGGHFVLGHVDGTAGVATRRRDAEWEWMDFACDSSLTNQMVPKGSVAVDGVSLTLVHVSPGCFGVMLIPHTLLHTTLGLREIGTTVNIETDILGKYIIHAVGSLRTEK
jgi:riboflavin synthase